MSGVQTTQNKAVTAVPTDANRAGGELPKNPAEIQKDLMALLQKAGLERSADGQFVVKDTNNVSQIRDQRVTAAENVYSGSATQLRPPAPPTIEITPELQQGAISFANNIDRVFNETFTKPVPTITGTQISAADIKTMQAALSGLDPKSVKEGSAQRVGPNRAPAPTDTHATTGPMNEVEMRRIAELTADILLAAFLKLNINDPNNSVQTHNQLQTVMTELRQQAINNAREAEKNAEVARKEAENYAQIARIVNIAVQVVMIAITLVVTALTFGAGAVLFVACAMAAGAIAGAAKEGNVEGALSYASIAGSVATLGLGVGALSGLVNVIAQNAGWIMFFGTLAASTAQVSNAAVQTKSNSKNIEAQEKAIEAKRQRALAEMFQNQISEENEVMKMIMESKNSLVDAILKMMNAMFATRQKLMSAGIAR